MPTYQRQFTIAPISGGVGDISASLAAISGSLGVLSGTLGTVNDELDLLQNKPIAVPQTELSSAAVNTAFYQLHSVLPVFVGHAGATAAMMVGFAVPVVGGSGNEIFVTNITSDAAGLNSVVGSGYAENPYVWFSEPIPNAAIQLRYGTQNTLGGLPEGVLLIEPMKIAEVQADTQAWIAAIKGEGYDASVPPTRSLLGLDSRLGDTENALSGAQSSISSLDTTVGLLDDRTSALENKVGSNIVKEFGIAPEFGNMVFDDNDLVDTDGTWIGGIELGTSVNTYLEWSTNVPAPLQSNRIRIMVKLPHDFGSWHPSEPIKVSCKGTGDPSKLGLSMSLHDVFGNVTNLDNVPMSFNIDAWGQYIGVIVNGVFTANHWFCLSLMASAQDIGNTIKIGKIDFKYLTA